MELAVTILAAGQSKRLHSYRPKVLHPVVGRPMIQYGIDLARAVGVPRPIIVVGHRADMVRETIGNEVDFVTQEEQLGTAHAVMQARPLLENREVTVIIFYGDMPLLRPETIQALVRRHAETRGETPLSILTTIGEDPMGFGRVIRDSQSRVVAIVEEADATPQQRCIRELNCGVYCVEGYWLWEQLARISVSPKGEYYLTELVALAAGQGVYPSVVTTHDVEEAQGINDRTQLAQAERIMRRRINERWMQAGVTLVDPETTYIEPQVEIGKDVTIHPNTHLQGRTRIGRASEIGPNTIVRDSTLGEGCRVLASVVESAILEDEVECGPFCHLRRGAHLGRGVHMGNFGEVKNSCLGAGTKMGHFSYLGDAKVGEKVNIGAGTITCNYDGVRKHETIIEDEAFIGSDTMLVAPVRIGARARTGAGAVVTRDVPPESTVMGVPARTRESAGKQESADAGQEQAV